MKLRYRFIKYEEWRSDSIRECLSSDCHVIALGHQIQGYKNAKNMKLKLLVYKHANKIAMSPCTSKIV